MLRSLATVALISGLTTLGACTDVGDTEEVQEMVGEEEPEPDLMATEEEVEVTVAPAPAGYETFVTNEFTAGPAGDPGIGGTVELSAPPENPGEGALGYRVHVRVEGLSEGPHAWHIHSAPCGEQAPVVLAFTPTADMPGIGEPLAPGANGVAEQAQIVPPGRMTLESLRGTRHSVHVHQTGGVNHGPTVACANLF